MSSVRTLGGRLRAARLKAGMSQMKLSAASGLPKPTLSRYENDHVEPSLGSLNRIATALDVTEGSLLRDSDSPEASLVTALEALGVVIRSVEQAERIADLVAEAIRSEEVEQVVSA